MSAVKAGDRVRLTCGESVLVGTATAPAPDGRIYVVVDEDDVLRAFALSLWTVEVIPPPIPDIAGTIVRDEDGNAWQRHDDGWCCVGSYSYPLADVESAYGPLAVLWTPEVTS